MSEANLTPDSKTEDYLEFLYDCLRLRNYDKRDKKIAIIGAGMAGLTACWVLQKNGYDVKVFEASNRVGGRVKTLREKFTPGLYVEAGAMRIPSCHKLTQILIQQFDLKTINFKDDLENTLVYIDGGNPATMKEYLHGNAPFAEGNVGSKMLEDCLDPVKKIYDKNRDISDKEKLYNLLSQISLGEYLRHYVRGDNNPFTDNKTKKLTDKDFELILLEESRANMNASLLEVLRDHDAHTDKKKDQIVGGMDRLPNAFIEQSWINPDTILYNARVRRLYTKSGKIFSIEYENTTTHETHKEKSFDKVIIAIPFSSLCHVRIEPFETDNKGKDKLKAIRNLHYENATKIALEFSDKFWEYYKIVGGRSITDLPIRWVHYPTKSDENPDENQYKGDHGILLASYTWGEDSLRWSALNKDERIRYAYDNIKLLHSDAFDKFNDTQLVAGMSYSWAEDSYSLGAFAIFPPYQEDDYFNEIWKDLNGIHFAGEHTSLKHAWIEGAVESGLRAAQEVHNVLKSS